MFNYLDELYELSSCKTSDFADKFKLIMLSNNVLYISGFLKVLSYSDELVVLKVKNDEIYIEGKNMDIKSLDKGEIIIKGNVVKIYMSKGENSEK
ncbi:MAG: YabP/YqfC family sporulation protein [Clostridia bacterium]|nr:YabP/YqfC family sporulation protein [Clostridia bacterium]